MSITIKSVGKPGYYELIRKGYRLKRTASDKEGAKLYAYDLQMEGKDVVIMKRRDENFYSVMTR